MLQLFVANVLGFLYYHWKKILIVAGALVITAACFYLVEKLTRKEPKLNREEIQMAQQAIERNDREQMLYVLSRSEAREIAADKTVEEAKEARSEAIANVYREWANRSNEELAAELERRARE